MMYNTTDMDLAFEIGDAKQPKGHAVAYFRSSADKTVVLATYLVVLPIRLDMTKYIPPMFAGSLPAMDTTNLSSIAIPPIPEQIESYQRVADMARTRGDDLVFAGTLDVSRPDSMLMAGNDAARLYTQLYAERPQTIAAPAPLADEDLNVQDVLYSMMGERDLLSEMAKLAGKLRYAVEGHDANQIREAIREMRAVALHLPEKYRIDDLIAAAQMSGDKGGKLAALYIDRCFRLCAEDYAEMAKIEAEIKSLQEA